MAVKFIEHIENGLIGFWEITETIDELLGTLSPESEELERFLSFKNDLRKKEWLAVRLLLQKMTGTKSKISYDPSGKPHLVNFPGFISISHSSYCVVIYLHPVDQPGIDIELITRNVVNPAKRFLSVQELNDSMIGNQLSNKEVMLRWCAKEAVFKMLPYSEIDFATQIICKAEPFNTKEGTFSATFTTSDDFLQIPLSFRLVGEILMVWGFLRVP